MEMTVLKLLELFESKYPKGNDFQNHGFPHLRIYRDGSGKIGAYDKHGEFEELFRFDSLIELTDHLEGDYTNANC